MSAARPNITIHDVAKAAGVSVSTVSRVLNNRVDVAPEPFQGHRRIGFIGGRSELISTSERQRG